MVGDYLLEGRIGAGGMGIVFRAIQPIIRRPVAIKVLHPSWSGRADAVARFVREARTIHRVKHRGVPDVFTFGTLPNGLHYYVMELLEGEDLRARLKRLGRLPPATALRIATGVASILDAAHKAGIVHRDLKPENVFLAGDEATGDDFEVKLLDFGIAKLAPDSPDMDGLVTGGRSILGTPVYMSPEQCLGGAVDARSDIYSLGVLVYEMLAGAPPFPPTGEHVLERKLSGEAPPILGARSRAGALRSAARERAGARSCGAADVGLRAGGGRPGRPSLGLGSGPDRTLGRRRGRALAAPLDRDRLRGGPLEPERSAGSDPCGRAAPTGPTAPTGGAEASRAGAPPDAAGAEAPAQGAQAAEPAAGDRARDRARNAGAVLMMRALSLFVLASTCAVAHAESVQEAAKHHRDAANAAFEVAQYDRAIQEFRIAYELEPDPRLFYNLALAHLKKHELSPNRSDLVQSRDYFKRFLAFSKDADPKLKSLAEGCVARLEAELAKEEAPPPPPQIVVEAPPPVDHTTSTVLLSSSGGLGAIAVVTGIFAVRASNRAFESALNDDFTGAEGSSNRARSFALATDVLLVGGILTAAAGIFLYFSELP